MYPILDNLLYPENSLEILHEGERLAQELDSPELVGIFIQLGYYHGYAGEYEIAIEYAEKAFEEAIKLDDIVLLANTANALCLNYVLPWKYRRIREIAPKIILEIEKALPQKEIYPALLEAYSDLCSMYGMALRELGKINEAEIYHVKGIQAAKDSKSLFDLGTSDFYYSLTRFHKGDIESAIAYGSQATKYFAQASAPEGLLGTDWGMLGLCYCETQDFVAAKTCAERGLKILNESGMQTNRFIHLLILGLVAFEFGDQVRAVKHFEKAIKAAKENREMGPEGIAMVYWGHYYGRINPAEWKKAEESILKGTKRLGEEELIWWVANARLLAGEMLLEAGQDEKAKKCLTQAESSFREMTCDYWADKAKKALDRL
jgi:tetratricopeptide (TPR) repeat protein